eukprot:Rhum_TRINITY_DN7963_c0_g1::Rhum_TRINITY_DN7963_c0_g1_i1::g.25461::m.25461/K12837/U2AF2; splicing factor U2AF 65 kDa subunit
MERERRRRDDGDRREKKERKEKRKRGHSSSDDEGASRAKRRTRVGRSGWDQPPAGGAPAAPGAAPGAPVGPGALALTVAGVTGSARPAAPAGPAEQPQDPNARRLYVGNVAQQLTDDMVHNFFKMHAMSLRHRLYKKRIKQAEELGHSSDIVPKVDDTVSPIANCSITRGDDSRPGFAFLELFDEDLTTECLVLDAKPCPLADGTIVQMKVSRPKNYNPPPPPLIPTWMKSKDSLTLPAHAKGRVCMTGIPENMPDAEIRELLETFGPLECYQLISEADGASQTCCVFSFDSEETDNAAINALNGMDLDGELVLNVRKVGAGALVLHIPKTEANPEEVQQEAEKKVLQCLVNLAKGLHETVQVLSLCTDPSAPTLPGTVSVKKPTKILALLNMFDSEDLENPESFEQIKAEIEREAETYGRVVNLTVPKDYPPLPERQEKPPKPELMLMPQTQQLRIASGPFGQVQMQGPPPGYALDRNSQALIPLAKLDEEQKRIETENAKRTEEWEKVCKEADDQYFKAKATWEREIQDPIKNGVGKVFIEYWTADEAHKAQVAMAGRMFDGRTVITSFLPEDWFHESAGGDESFDDILKALELEDAPEKPLAIEE